MGRFSFGQVIVFILFFLLIFGDFSKMTNNLKVFLNNQGFKVISKKKDRKKGI